MVEAGDNGTPYMARDYKGPIAETIRSIAGQLMAKRCPAPIP
jgi:hypothetical protein